MPPFFSVIITVYNKVNFIGETIQSVLNQSYENFELIIINDGSTDQSLSVIKGFNDPRIEITSTTNKGASASRNLGIAKSKGTFLAFLDGDDLWDSEFLNAINTAILEFGSFNVFSSLLTNKYDHRTKPCQYSIKFKKNIEVHNYFKASLKTSILSSSSVVVRKSKFEEIGSFNEKLLSGEDIDMWIRIGIKHEIVVINKVLCYYRHTSSSLSNSTFDVSKKPNFEDYKVLEKDNKDLKKFLDLNRYSFALTSKINNQKGQYIYHKSQIDRSNLALKKRILLESPKWALNFLLWIKSFKKEKLYYKPLKT